LELKAEESASTCVGQNSTQKPQALQRSTTIETLPFATRSPQLGVRSLRLFNYAGCDYAGDGGDNGVIEVTVCREVKHPGVANYWTQIIDVQRLAEPSVAVVISLLRTDFGNHRVIMITVTNEGKALACLRRL
jgi:hypothetical protein